MHVYHFSSTNSSVLSDAEVTSLEHAWGIFGCHMHSRLAQLHTMHRFTSEGLWPGSIPTYLWWKLSVETKKNDQMKNPIFQTAPHHSYHSQLPRNPLETIQILQTESSWAQHRAPSERRFLNVGESHWRSQISRMLSALGRAFRSHPRC